MHSMALLVQKAESCLLHASNVVGTEGWLILMLCCGCCWCGQDLEGCASPEALHTYRGICWGEQGWEGSMPGWCRLWILVSVRGRRAKHPAETDREDGFDGCRSRYVGLSKISTCLSMCIQTTQQVMLACRL